MNTSTSPLKEEIIERWNESSITYDSCAGHGIHTYAERTLWKKYISSVLPSKSLRVLDVGCGTGQISVLMSEMGHTVTGLDLSPGMMEKAKERAKAKNLNIEFQYGDAENPPFEPGSFDLIIERHLLWTLPHPKEAVSRWNSLLAPDGGVMLIEGLWNDGSYSTRIRRGFSAWCERVMTGAGGTHKEYSESLKNALPFQGGLTADQATAALKEGGFSDVVITDLTPIRKNQMSRMPWYKRLNYNWSYFLAYGKKR